VTGKPLHVHTWTEFRRSGRRYREVCTGCLRQSEWFTDEGDKPVTHKPPQRGARMTIYDGPYWDRDREDERLHMEFEVAYQWPVPGRCSVWTCPWHGTVYLTKHGPTEARPLGRLYSRCPNHQAQYEARALVWAEVPS